MPLYNPSPDGSIGVIYDGSGSSLQNGNSTIVFVTCEYNAVITNWQLVADQAGSCIIDVWKNSFSNFPPTSSNSICSTDFPTLSSQQSNQNTNLTLWTTSVNSGDVFAFRITSASTVTRVTLTLRLIKT